MINVADSLQELSGEYSNVVLLKFNDHVVRLSMMTCAYFWHFHPDSDELFYGVEGTVAIELENRVIHLTPGTMFLVPMGVKHRTSPVGGRSVNLTMERAAMTTIRTD